MWAATAGTPMAAKSMIFLVCSIRGTPRLREEAHCLDGRHAGVALVLEADELGGGNDARLRQGLLTVPAFRG